MDMNNLNGFDYTIKLRQSFNYLSWNKAYENQQNINETDLLYKLIGR